MHNISLLQTATADNLMLSGLYKSGDTAKPAVILIHGFTGDFYTHPFNHAIQNKLSQHNIASVSIQTRGTGIQTEIMHRDRYNADYIGSYYEKLEDAHFDISAWIEELQQLGYSKFILAGHSLGTIKSVRYLFEGKYADLIEKLVLLAPFDKNGYVQRKTQGEWRQHIKLAQAKIEQGEELRIITPDMDDFAMSYRTYYSWYHQSDLNSVWDFYRGEAYDFPILNQIKIPVQIIVGDKDEFFYMAEFNTLEQVKSLLKKNIAQLDLQIVEDSGHIYTGYELTVADRLYDFIV